MLAVQDRVLDFGCGAGRIAIKMLMQKVRPNRFVGVDVSQKMIEWCRQNLSVYDSNFTFYHHDVFSPVYAPDNSHNDIAPLPAEDAAFSLLVSHSVFSHLYEFQARHYLSELARVLEPGGLIYILGFSSIGPQSARWRHIRTASLLTSMTRVRQSTMTGRSSEIL